MHAHRTVIRAGDAAKKRLVPGCCGSIDIQKLLRSKANKVYSPSRNRIRVAGVHLFHVICRGVKPSGFAALTNDQEHTGWKVKSVMRSFTIYERNSGHLHPFLLIAQDPGALTAAGVPATSAAPQAVHRSSEHRRWSAVR
jgi:hypothetical protein